METAEIDALRRDILDYAVRRKGKIYAPIDHPALADIPSEHGADRFELIASHLHSFPSLRTALDIGTHWGFFAHRLEQRGLEVTAVENMQEYLKFLYRLRSLYGDRFTVYEKNLFSMQGVLQYDLVLGLNIFHHFIKTKETYCQFLDFLARLRCKVMFFQAHSPGEGQMQQAHRNFAPEAFCEFLIEHSCLNHVQRIGQFRNRPMFMLTSQALH